MKRIPQRYIWLIAALIISGMTFGGCVSLSEDITPPPSPAAATAVETPREEVDEPASASSTPETVEDEQPEDQEPAPAETEVFFGVVTVHLVDQGAEGLGDAEVTVRLEGFDHMTEAYTGTETVSGGQEVRFEDVPMRPGRLFFASVTYRGAVYRSDIAQVEGETEALSLDVEVFGTTTDQSALSIDRVHVFVDFPSPEVVQLGEMFVISNFGDQTVVAGEDREFVLEFTLPEDATNLSFQNGSLGGRFQKTERGFGDTASIPPGSGVYQVMAFYDLPYQRSRLSFRQELPLPVGAAIIMTPVGDLQVKGDQLQDMGVRQIQNGSIQVYIRENISAGEDFTFTMNGSPEAVSQGTSAPEDQRQRSLLIGAGLLGVILIAVGLWYYRRTRHDEMGEGPLESATSRQQVLDEIIALDDQFQAGELEEEVYRDRRAALKDQLSVLVKQEQEEA